LLKNSLLLWKNTGALEGASAENGVGKDIAAGVFEGRAGRQAAGEAGDFDI
jgi:hypothetical protein